MTEEQRKLLKEIAEKLKGRILFPEAVARAKEYLAKAVFLTKEESDVITIMKSLDKCDPKLAYDATVPGYFLTSYGEIKKEIVDSLLQKGLIYDAEVIHGGSVQLYELTNKEI